MPAGDPTTGVSPPGHSGSKTERSCSPCVVAGRRLLSGGKISYIGSVRRLYNFFRDAVDTTSVTAIQAIQAILAPALGISAVGLLLLGLSTRYSTIINRIRLLNDERRRLERVLVEKGELNYADNMRYASIHRQQGELLIRSRLVRNAILAMQASVALFVLTSAAIGFTLISDAAVIRALPLILFITGMLSVFAGVAFSALEVYRSYRIVLLEVKAEE